VRNDAVARALIHLSRRGEARNDLRGAHLQDLNLGELGNSGRGRGRDALGFGLRLSSIARSGRMKQRKVLHFDASVAPTTPSSGILCAAG
jgi:hypothetical protein